MSNESKAEAGGMDPQDDEALWNLLGRQSPPVKVSPYFARRVLREVALDDERHGGWWARVRRWTLPPRHPAVWSGAFALGLLCLSAVLVIPGSRPPVARPADLPTYPVEFATAAADAVPAAAPAAPDTLEEAAPVQDVELIADLDNLLNREESRLWTEDDTARF